LLPSEKILSERYNISRSSVRTALAELESQGIIYKKPGKGTFVRDTSILSRELVKTIGIDIDLANQSNDYWYGTNILKGVQEACDEEFYRLLLVNRQNLSYLKDGFADGVIISGARPLEYNMLEKLAEEGLHVALLNRITDLENLAYFSVDYRRSSYEGAKVLLGKNCRNIGVVSTGVRDQGNHVEMARYLGLLDALKDRGNSDGGVKICQVEAFKDKDYYTDKIKEFLQNTDVDGIYLLNGAFMEPLLFATQQLEMKPTDLQVLCFDDVEYLYKFFKYSFIYVKMPLKEMGRDAAEYMVNKIKDSKNTPIVKKLYQAEIIECGYGCNKQGE
jgi:DNA-binding LacI/PurR family transcriptional regulator